MGRHRKGDGGAHDAGCELEDHGVLIESDGPTASCAACGVKSEGQGCARRSVDGKLIMLCVNASACASRYREGLTAAKYGEYLRTLADADSTF